MTAKQINQATSRDPVPVGLCGGARWKYETILRTSTWIVCWPGVCAVRTMCGDPSMLQGTNPRRLTWPTSGHVSNESSGSKLFVVAQIGPRHRSEGSGLWCLLIRSKGSSCRTVTSLELAKSAVATDTYWSFWVWEGFLFSFHRQPFEVDWRCTY